MFQPDETHLSVPQKPSAKTKLDEDDDDALSVSQFSSTSKRNSSQLDVDALRRLSASPLRNGRFSPLPLGQAPDPKAPLPWRSRASKSLGRFWTRNRSVLLVAVSQFFGALMNLTARLLELEGEGMHPFQVLFARQSLTMICCCIYMYTTKVPDFPLGRRDVRWLLVVRGLSGFFGIYGLWYSMMYLPLAEATVITFLAPSVAGYFCYVLLHEPFTRIEQVASFIALAGVVLIAHPASLFSSESPATMAPPENPGNRTSTLPGLDHQATAAERLSAIGIALIGVLGAAGAFTTIRWIGQRAHPLISVNYFATWCTIVCTVVLTAAPLLDIDQPALRFAAPGSARQWGLLIFLGVFGFIMQFMMTAGLGSEKSNRANAMIYTHMLFAAGFDRWVFGHQMGLVSLAGCGLIIGSALWAILSKKSPKSRVESEDLGHLQDVEAMPMLMHVGEDIEDDVPLEQFR
jgi:drug/metabolite transporter (DMT)-like permease